MYMNMKNISYIFLFFILILALFLRVYKLDELPPSLMWDEAAVGYNAFSIASYGKDEWGQTLPLAFKSFEEYKMPVNIYITSLFIKIGGLNEWTTRLPAAIFGTLSVLIIFFLTRKIFNSNLAGLVSALLLAVSPYSIHFSRFAHEANFAICFFMLGLLLFFISLKKKSKLLAVSFFCFGLSLISYNAAKVVVPLLLLLLAIFYFKELWVIKKAAFIAGLVLAFFLVLIILYPGLSGKSRAEQTGLNIKNFDIFKERYLSHFSKGYLITSGDQNRRLSVQVTGQSNYPEMILLGLGVLAVFVKRVKVGFFLLFWLLLAPVPATIFGGESEFPHAARTSFSLGIWQILACFGFLFATNVFQKIKIARNYIQITILLVLFIYLLILTKDWFVKYLNNFNEYAIEWQYGMKQIVEYVKVQNYPQVYMTDVRSQPYIYFLYYMQTPLPQFLKSVEYNNKANRSANLVSFYEKFYFGGWDEIESMPNLGVLYVVSPSKYDGLRHKRDFKVKKIIYYPKGTEAFYMVSLY